MKKTLITILATVLVCCCVVGGTLAWLMDSTDPIVNTFTVGNVDITLTETKGTAVTGGKSFQMVPGRVIDKDPTVTVVGGSEACWLFIKVEESSTLDTYIAYVVDSEWTALGAAYPGVYYRSVAKSDTDQPFAVLGADDSVDPKWAANQVYVKDTVTKDEMDALNAQDAVQPTLKFTAYAVQSEGVADAATAWGYLPTT